MRRTRRFGLNYVPSRRWYYLWNEWDAGIVRADFEACAALGIDHLRVQLIWPYFQPNAGIVSPTHLERLEELMSLASAAQLDVLLCPLTGWLSGYRFLPPDVEPLDIFLKEETFERIQRYFKAILTVMKGRSNFLGFDLGNEINVLVPTLAMRDGDAWGERLCGWLRPKMGGKWIVNGVDHNPWFRGGTFGVKHLVKDYDAVCVHAWPFFTGCLERGGLADRHSVTLAAFLTRFCRSQLRHEGLEKPVWIQEFGCSRLWGSLPERKAYMERTLSAASDAGATWFTWWCSHDIDPRFRFDALEYDLGLFTTKNEPKPLAQLYKKLISTYANSPAASDADAAWPGWNSKRFRPDRTKVLPPSQWVRQNLHTTSWELFEEYLAGKK